MGSDNLTSADDQQVGRPEAAYPNDHNGSPVASAQRVMGWSDLHGDMQTEAEMTSGRQRVCISDGQQMFRRPPWRKSCVHPNAIALRATYSLSG